MKIVSNTFFQIIVVIFLAAMCAGLTIKEEDHNTEALFEMSADPGFFSRLVEYRGVIPGYWVSIIQNSGTNQIAHLSVSLCPLTSGRDCIEEEVSQVRLTRDGPWQDTFCGGRMCPDQESTRALVQTAVKEIYNPLHVASSQIDDDV